MNKQPMFSWALVAVAAYALSIGVDACAEDYVFDSPAASASATQPLLVSPKSVQVQRDGDRFSVDLVMHTEVPLATVWSVLTDFSRMPRIVPNLQTSTVREGADAQHLILRQTGVATFGPFSKDYDSTREIVLVPRERISAHNIAGTVKAMDSVMVLSPEHDGTRLSYHANVEPGFWLPPVVGVSSVQSQTAEQFSALLREMKRRSAKVVGSGAPGTEQAREAAR